MGGECMSYTEKALKTKQAKEAMVEGLFTWLSTGDFQKGWNKMISHGKKNGSYLTLKIAVLFDFLNALGGNSNNNKSL